MIGAWGNILVFEVSPEKLLTPNDVQVGGGAARYATHELLGAKPKREFIGPGLGTCSMQVTISALRGVSPRAQLDALRAERDAGATHALILGGKNVFAAGSLATLDSIDEDWQYFTGSGVLLQATGSLSFTEYVPPKQQHTVDNAAGTVSKSNTTRARQ